MFEELLISVLFIIVLIILCIISNLYSKKEEEKEKNKRRQEYEELHTLSGRINYHRSQEISTYKIDEYKIGDWENLGSSIWLHRVKSYVDFKIKKFDKFFKKLYNSQVDKK